MTIRAHKIAALFAILVCTAAGSLAARADEPTPAALETARTIILASGVSRSFDLVVPTMLGELEHNVVATRPEIKESLHATLLALQPEFNKTEQDVINGAAVALARQMTEAELKDTLAFFQSASGKKYVDSQPKMFNEIVALAQAWRQKLSVDVLTRAREEMKKKGVDF